jgi:hypothetical protein
MANVLEILITADNQASGVLSTVLGGVESLDGGVGNVFLKPTKAAEMIILNFIVTTQSSTFDENINTGSI